MTPAWWADVHARLDAATKFARDAEAEWLRMKVQEFRKILEEVQQWM